MSPMPPEIQAAIRGFKDIILGGVPILLKANETAFLSFLCMVSAIDALAGWRYTDEKRFEQFIRHYFPPSYAPHAEKLWLFRCRMLHNFSPAYFTVMHAAPALHLGRSPINDTILSDETFFADLRAAATKFFAEVENDGDRQRVMHARLVNVQKGGAIFTAPNMSSFRLTPP